MVGDITPELENLGRPPGGFMSSELVPAAWSQDWGGLSLWDKGRHSQS